MLKLCAFKVFLLSMPIILQAYWT